MAGRVAGIPLRIRDRRVAQAGLRPGSVGAHWRLSSSPGASGVTAGPPANGSSSPSVGGMKQLLARLELIEATGVLEVDVGWVNGNYQRILFHTVRTGLGRPGARDGGPAPWCASSTRRGATPSTRPSTCTASSSTATASWSRPASTTCSRRSRQAVDRIVHRYRRLGAVLLDPDVGDDELRARLLSTVPEAQLREDQSDLENWTRGDRKARFEQTAERHAGLRRFAGPFLSRMKFVDEQGEEASPTLSALRAYREHRAAGRRGVPPDAPLDFAPAALQPLIRHDGVTDRRRWESALFLKVRDEYPDRQPRHRRREELRPVRGVLPARRAVGASPRSALGANRIPRRPRRGGRAAEARLSDAFDRFLEVREVAEHVGRVRVDAEPSPRAGAGRERHPASRSVEHEGLPGLQAELRRRPAGPGRRRATEARWRRWPRRAGGRRRSGSQPRHRGSRGRRPSLVERERLGHGGLLLPSRADRPPRPRGFSIPGFPGPACRRRAVGRPSTAGRTRTAPPGSRRRR